MSKGTRQSGEFCWINMITPQPKEARAFFVALLGWTYFEIPGMGHGVEVAGHKIGGLFDLDGPNTPKRNIEAAIGVMLKVDSAPMRPARRSASLGRKTKPPFDVMDQGRMAVCFDPNGAEFDVWEPKKNDGTDVDTSLHGAPSWFETLTSDVDRASAFYAGLFGWTPETTTPMPGVEYTHFKHGNEYVAGMMQLTPQMRTTQPHWGTYFTVRDADETAREAVKLGAKLCVPSQDIPGVGRFGGITSPQGVVLYVIKYAR